MDLRKFLSGMPADQREAFALNCRTTLGHLRNVMYGYRPCGVDTAVLIERHSQGAVTRQELRQDWADLWPELEKQESKQPLPSAARSSSAINSEANAS